jgi:hypothetical protein
MGSMAQGCLPEVGAQGFPALLVQFSGTALQLQVAWQNCKVACLKAVR